MSSQQSILLIEDAPEVVALVKKTLQGVGDFYHAVTLREVEEIIQCVAIDIILLDLMLPDISGHELISVFNNHKNTMNSDIVVVSAKSDVYTKVISYQLGAINYIEKPFDTMLLRSIVKSYLMKKSNIETSIIDVDGIQIDLFDHSLVDGDLRIKFTHSEVKLILYMLERHGRVLTREQLMKAYAKDTLDYTDRSVDQHIRSLRKKISKSRIVIHTLYGEGYQLIVQKKIQARLKAS